MGEFCWDLGCFINLAEDVGGHTCVVGLNHGGQQNKKRKYEEENKRQNLKIKNTSATSVKNSTTTI